MFNLDDLIRNQNYDESFYTRRGKLDIKRYKKATNEVKSRVKLSPKELRTQLQQNAKTDLEKNIEIEYRTGKDKNTCPTYSACDSKLGCSRITTKNDFTSTVYTKVESIINFFHQRFGYRSTYGSKNRPAKVREAHPTKQIAGAYLERTEEGKSTGNRKIILSEPIRSKLVLSHEFTHCILHHVTDLASYDQPGALHESLADVMGFIFLHYMGGKFKNRHEEKEFWDVQVLAEKKYRNNAELKEAYEGYGRNISDGTYRARGNNGVAVETKANHFKQFKKCIAPEFNYKEDSGYIHLNSLIPSHAFYLSVKGMGADYPSYGVIASVWFNAMLDVQKFETFASFAHRTIEEAGRCNEDSQVKRVITKAWSDVGVTPRPYSKKSVDAWNYDLDQRCRLGLTVSDDMKVTNVLPNSCATRAYVKRGNKRVPAAIKVGDFIESISYQKYRYEEKAKNKNDAEKEKGCESDIPKDNYTVKRGAIINCSTYSAKSFYSGLKTAVQNTLCYESRDDAKVIERVFKLKIKGREGPVFLSYSNEATT